MCTCLSQCLRLVVKQKSVIALCKVISMGQTSSKKPKDLPKRGSVNSQQSTPVENVRKISVFDHVMDQIVESSGNIVVVRHNIVTSRTCLSFQCNTRQ